MKRREFLKASALGTAALTAGSVLPSEARTIESQTPLAKRGFVKEPARKIPLVDSADVVVVGGGPAGFAAALAAARQGCDALILERQYFLGGLFTGCGVTPIINMFSPNGTKTGIQAVGGICAELCDALRPEGMLCYDGLRPKVDPEAAKYHMERMCSEARVRILYGVQAAQIVQSGDDITSIIVEGKSGRVAIACKAVIDASGDGDILEWAGEDFEVRKNDIGAMWRIGNAENSKVGSKAPCKGVKTRHTPGEKNQDGLDMYNLSRVQILLRKYMWEDARKLREQEGCQDLYVIDTPSVVGVRTTRVLNSVGNVTSEGAATGETYPDVIGYSGGDSTLKIGDKKISRNKRRPWQIPYSALLPKKTGNLLVAGRCFGFDEALTYDAREVATCFVTGQAAGTAAALSVASRCSVREVDVHALQSALRKDGVIFDI